MITGKVLGENYIKDGSAADVSGFVPDMSGDIYYEVVRLIDSRFLFLQGHIDRLENSLKGSGLKFPGTGYIKENLRLLQKKNRFTEGNIRICVQHGSVNQTSLLSYYVPYFYPEVCMYMSGVQVVSYPHVRPKPGIKKWDDNFRISVNEYIRDHGVYEAVLHNTQKQITEGSRSNIFFINPLHQLITPQEVSVLPGITRKHVLDICLEEGIKVIERPVSISELKDMPVCFISGTSPKILPVWQLDGFQFKVDHPLLKLLMERFESMIKENLTCLLAKADK